MVHRLLAAAIEPHRFQPPALDKYHVERQCEHCNVRKQAAKLVQEMSTELYLGLFVRQANEMKTEAMVLMMLDRAFDVLILKFGVVKRVYLDKLPLDNYNHEKSNKKVTLTLYWKAEKEKGPTIQEIKLFTLVRVCLQPLGPDTLKFGAILLRPS